MISYEQPTNPRSARVVIIDTDRRVQASLADLLTIDGRVQVAGQAGDIRSALELIDRERPTAVVLDPRLPDIAAGAALVASLRRGWPSVRIVLSGWWDESGEQPGLTANAQAYVSKSASPEELVTAVVACCQ